MTVSNTSSSTTVTCNGSQTVFNYNFYIPPGGTYWQLQQIDLSGNVTTIPTSAYSVNNVGSTTGGTFTYPLTGSPVAAGYQLTLSRALPYVQSTSLANQGNYYPAVVEAALDWIVLLLQQFLTGSTTAALQQQLSNEIAARIAAVAAITNSIGQPNGIAGLNSLGRLGDISTAQAKFPGSTTEVFIGSMAGGIPTPKLFGAVMDGVTDDIAALNALTAYVNANTSGAFSNETYFDIDFNGQVCAISQPWTPPSCCHIHHGALFALAGASWTSTSGMLNVGNGVFSVSVSDFFLDGNIISNVQLWYVTSTSGIFGYNVQGRHWGAGGNGVVVNGGKIQFINCNVGQWSTVDSQYGVLADRAGNAMMFYGSAADSTVIGGNLFGSLQCLDIDETCQHLRFIGVHFFNGGGGTPLPNIALGSIRGYLIVLSDCYHDSGYWKLPVTSASQQQSPPTPSVTFDGGVLLYNAANATYPAWFAITTTQPNTDLSSFVLRGLFAKGTATEPMFSFATSGSGAFNATVPTAFLSGVTANVEVNGNTINNGSSINFGGVNGLIGNLLNQRLTPGGGGGTTSLATDSGGMISSYSASEPVVLSNAAAVGTIIFVTNAAGAGNTVSVQTGGTMNNVAAGSLGLSVGQAALCLCTHQGSGSNAAWSVWPVADSTLYVTTVNTAYTTSINDIGNALLINGASTAVSLSNAAALGSRIVLMTNVNGTTILPQSGGSIGGSTTANVSLENGAAVLAICTTNGTGSNANWALIGNGMSAAPVAESTVTPSASPYAYTATQYGWMQLNGGTITGLTIARAGARTLGTTTAAVPMSPGDVLTVTYSTAPTMHFFPT